MITPLQPEDLTALHGCDESCPTRLTKGQHRAFGVFRVANENLHGKGGHFDARSLE